MTTAPTLDLVGTTETTITVEFKPLPNVNTYQLQWKEYPAQWQQLSKTTVQSSSSKKKTVQVSASDLNPGATYCVRLVCSNANGTEEGEPGPELIIDTEQVGCTPKSSGCILL